MIILFYFLEFSQKCLNYYLFNRLKGAKRVQPNTNIILNNEAINMHSSPNTYTRNKSRVTVKTIHKLILRP